jgi:hypothetical protein
VVNVAVEDACGADTSIVGEAKTCELCNANVATDLETLACGHNFHAQCLRQYMRTTGREGEQCCIRKCAAQQCFVEVEEIPVHALPAQLAPDILDVVADSSLLKACAMQHLLEMDSMF